MPQTLDIPQMTEETRESVMNLIENTHIIHTIYWTIWKTSPEKGIILTRNNQKDGKTCIL